MQIAMAVVSSSRNAPDVLDAAGLTERFAVVVDGNVANRLGLAGKPAPDMFLEAARELQVEPGRTVVVEDAVSGVAAGRAGGFALVLGIDRGAGPETLLTHGADMVVGDLMETLPGGDSV
jgi:HAD superfamily hydrolase (TIGR01509 family)